MELHIKIIEIAEANWVVFQINQKQSSQAIFDFYEANNCFDFIEQKSIEGFFLRLQFRKKYECSFEFRKGMKGCLEINNCLFPFVVRFGQETLTSKEAIGRYVILAFQSSEIKKEAQKEIETIKEIKKKENEAVRQKAKEDLKQRLLTDKHFKALYEIGYKEEAKKFSEYIKGRLFLKCQNCASTSFMIGLNSIGREHLFFCLDCNKKHEFLI